ncbi:hypothetical protein AKO1_006945 [Acrasis kona]|uniref:Uncharacterized protein n=1 Tax=Acrasis kona TaxID=1008807 RepID=A0AAW2YTP4_9EUKA
MFFGPQSSHSPVGPNILRQVGQNDQSKSGQSPLLDYAMNLSRSNPTLSPSNFGGISPTIHQSPWSPTDQDSREWSMFTDNTQLQMNGGLNQRHDNLVRGMDVHNDRNTVQHQRGSPIQHFNNIQVNGMSVNSMGGPLSTLYSEPIPIQRSSSLGSNNIPPPMQYQPGPPATRSNSGNSAHKLTLDSVVRRQQGTNSNRFQNSSPHSTGSNTPSSPNHHAHDHYLMRLSQSNPQGTKTFKLRKSYLENCKLYQLVPSMELMRSLKTCIKSQQSLKRLSVCHAMLEDQHVSALIDTLISCAGNHDVDEILLNHNAITDVGATELSRKLLDRSDSSIVSLELFGNKIGDESCKAISDTLSNGNGSQLRRLKLGDNNIGAHGADILSQGLLRNHTLTQLHLGGNNIGARGLECIAKSLFENVTLTSLGLRDNQVGSEGMRHLSAALMRAECALSDVQLKGNTIGAEGAGYLAEALRVNKSLKVLELQSNDIGPLGARFICDALCCNESVHAVNFNDNELGDEGAEAVADLLKHNQSITTLGLASNRIRKRGATALSSSLGIEHDPKITGLDLGGNEIGNNGAVALSKALIHNNTMTSLDLRSCEIHLKGCVSLAEMSQYNTTLRHLDLGANHCKNQGANAWAEVLKKNSSLTRLCLTDNQVSHDGGLALAAAMQTNYSLRNFSYGGQGIRSNKIESSIRKVIDSIVSENKRQWECVQSEQEDDKPAGGQDQESEQDGNGHSLNGYDDCKGGEIMLPYKSNNQYRTIDVYKMCDMAHNQQQQPLIQQSTPHAQQLHQQQQPQQQQQPAYSSSPRSIDDNMNGNYNSPTLNQSVPSWFSATSNMVRQPIDAAQLDQRLEYLFKNNLLKAQNPKFTGCYFIGNVINTLKKVFGEYSRLDEYQLVQFTYHNPKYYVHLSREMVKTQIKYIGDLLQEPQQPQYVPQVMNRSRSMPQQRTSPFAPHPQPVMNQNYLIQSYGLIGGEVSNNACAGGPLVSWNGGGGGGYRGDDKNNISIGWTEQNSYNNNSPGGRLYKNDQDHYSHF